MRTRILRGVGFAAIVALASTTPSRTAWVGCYAVRWHNASWGSLLPDSLRLRDPDSLLDSATGGYIVEPLRVAERSLAPWSSICNAWSSPGDSNDLSLTFTGSEARWTGDAFFRRGVASF